MIQRRLESASSPEEKVLLECIPCDRVDEGHLSTLLKQQLDWTRLRQLAIQHGVLPQLFVRLQAAANKLVPSAEMAAMKHSFQINFARNSFLAHQLTQVLDLLASHAINAIPVRGPILAVQAYGDIALRQFADLDILINREDFRSVYDALSLAGFYPQFPVNAKREKWLLRSDMELHFLRGNTHLDVHWAFSESWPIAQIPPERYWRQLRTVTLNGKDVRTFSPENMLELLWMHGSKHRWEKLQWVVDFIQLARHCPTQSLPSVAKHAESFSADAADQMNLALRDPAAFARAALAGSSRFTFRQRLFDLALGVCFPRSTDWLAIDLPDWLYPVYYLLRPCRLCWKYTRKLICSVFQNTP